MKLFFIKIIKLITMNRLFTRSLLIAVFTLCSVVATAQSEDSYTKTLKRYFVVTNSEKTSMTLFDHILNSIEQKYPNISKGFWTMIRTEFKKDLMNKYAMQLVPVYKKYLTQKELEEIVAFYESPVGKKMCDSFPAITSESMFIAQAWGRDLVTKVMDKMKEQGYSE